ncbi:unnamed protein product [Meganyctiphanes norvegica]|uniref:Uncharacterized protein n=1 Tax=Meganyctiphanes norvegica TaxID=48144 RepID=A0AAV2QC43_MEGNR
MDFLECKVCHVPYDEEDHRPRNSPCGHELCSACIKALIKDSIFECPKCRQKNKVDVPDDMPVCFGLIDVIRAFKNKSIKLANEAESIKSGATNEEVCNVHDKAISHWCSTCQLWICTECLESHSLLLGCSTSIAAKAMESIREEISKDTDVLLSVFEDKAKSVSSKIQVYTDKRKEFLEKAEECGKEVNMLCNLLEQGNLQKENVIESRKLLYKANLPNSVSDRVKDLKQRKQILRNWTVKSIGVGNDTPLGLLKTLKEGKCIYAEMLIKDEKRQAKLSQYEDRIHVHTFQKKTISDGCIYLPFDHLQKMIPDEAPLMFMEMSLGNQVKGRILIRLEKNMPNIRDYIVHIISGQKGPTMRGVRFNGYNTGNDIYANSLPFSKMQVIPDSNGKSMAKRGDIIGHFGYGYLNIIWICVAAQLKTIDYGGGRCVFGHVEKGMDVVQECYDKFSSGITVSDCGLVIEQD